MAKNKFPFFRPYKNVISNPTVGCLQGELSNRIFQAVKQALASIHFAATMEMDRADGFIFGGFLAKKNKYLLESSVGLFLFGL